MKTVMITCRTLEAEIRQAMKDTGRFLPVIYMESGLHTRPKKLADAVTELFRQVRADRVLLCIGQCGNALDGAKNGDFELIGPRVDDCLSLLIGSTKKKSRLSMDDRAFFMTAGWLKGESTIMSEYHKMSEKYGEDVALSIMEDMYAHYRTIGVLDTGIVPVDEVWNSTEEIAELLGFQRKIYPGTLEYIEQLLTGPWDREKFIIKRPFEVIKDADYRDSEDE